MVLTIVFTFALLLAIGVPISFVLGMSAVPYVFFSPNIPLTTIPQKIFTGLDSFLLVCLPFFMLASEIMNHGGITNRIIRFVNALLGHIRGGLGHVCVVVSMIFAGITGLASADLAAVGSMLIPAMKKEGYDDDFAVALTAGASTIGPIIPPSLMFVLYAFAVGGVSIAEMFLAGILPGIIMGLLMMVIVAFISKKRGYPVKKRASFSEIAKSFVAAFPALCVPLVMIGGLAFGIVTATEAACLGVLAALIVALFVYRDLKISKLFKIFMEVGVTVGSLLFIMAGATLLSWVLTRIRIPQMAVNLLLSISPNKYILFLVINIFLLIVGMFMDPAPSMLILAPILLPVVQRCGMTAVQFGIIITLNLVIGLTTPPVGECLFIAAAIGKVSLERVARAVLPFIVTNIVVLFLITYIPWLTRVVPSIFFHH